MEFSMMALGRDMTCGVCKQENTCADHYRDYSNDGWLGLFCSPGPSVHWSKHFHNPKNTPPCITRGCENQPIKLNRIGLSSYNPLWHPCSQPAVWSLIPGPRGRNVLYSPGSGLMIHGPLPCRSHHNKSLRNVLAVLFIINSHMTPLCWHHKSIARWHVRHYAISLVLLVSGPTQVGTPSGPPPQSWTARSCHCQAGTVPH